MAGPWEKYAQPQESGPWQKYASGGPDPVAQITGFMANLNRGLGIGDEIAGGLAAIPGAAQALGRGDLRGALSAFPEAMAGQRQIEDNYAADHPHMAALGRGTGMAATAVIPGGPVTELANATRLGNMGRGAVLAGTTGAAYAAADRGSAAERVQAASETARNPLVLGLGAAGGALAPVAARSSKVQVQKPATSPQQVLRQAGVSLTPGQQLGGIFKSTEDLAQRAPLLGPSIRGARQRGVESLARAQANRALDPIGEGVPKAVKTGNESVAYVADRLGKEYDRAAEMVPQVGHDAELKAARTEWFSAADELPTDVRKQFDTIIKNRLDSRFPDGAVITGKQLRDIQSDIGQIAAKRASSDDAAQQDLGHVLEAVSGSLKDTLGRFNPEVAPVIQKANEGWSNYIRLRNAASRSNTNGIPSVSQLSTAVRMSDRSVGKGNVAKGRALMQDLSSAASQVMPDAFGNPGTADAVGLGGLLVGSVTAPAQTLPVAGLLAAGATPYLMMGRKIVERLPVSASRQELEAASRELSALAAKDPSVARLQAQVAARLARTAGLLGRQPTVTAQLVDDPSVVGYSYGPAGR